MKKEFWEERKDRQGATLFIVQIEDERKLFFGFIKVEVKDKFWWSVQGNGLSGVL